MLDFRISSINSALRKVLIRLHYPLEVMLTCVRWYVAYPLSLRHVEEMMQERGVFVDHTTVHRWAIKMLPVLATVFRRRKRPVGLSWRMDETYIKVAGQWKYLYRAVGYDGIICGHFHHPALHNGFGTTSANCGCGDWSGNNTAIVEDFDGHLDLVRVYEKSAFEPTIATDYEKEGELPLAV